jgi:hypothetical protein
MERIGVNCGHSLPSIGSHIQLLAEYLLISVTDTFLEIASFRTSIGKAGDESHHWNAKLMVKKLLADDVKIF